jgi:asparagine synthase (glutamine-hydrolysing)
MCGIAGKLNFAPDAKVRASEVEAMLDPITHRGPDGRGVYVDGPAGLGHLRLSIIDLGTGAQPMTNEDGTVWIVFNGEIYNYKELRERLVQQGHQFRSHSDTEVIIHLYEEMGADCVRDLRGMFGFAIWDAKKRRMFIARDRVGIKPIYYCQTARAFSFASELKALLADAEVPRAVSLPAIREFLSFFYIPGEATLFQSIKKLLPGHSITIENGKVEIRKYWDLKFTQERWGKPFADVVEELHGLVQSTVKDHMMADVPVGVLLSGGVDSSAVLNFAVQGTEKKVKTFTMGFDGDQVVDERPYARLAAERFGTEHYDMSISAEDFWNFLPCYVSHMEEPVCEPPAVALYYISKLAREHVKVLLSGEGGDEAFGGYPNYPHMMQLAQIGAAVGPFAKAAGAGASLAGWLTGDERLDRYGHALGQPLASQYFSRSSGPTAYFNRHAGQLCAPDFMRATSAVSPGGYIEGLTAGLNGASLLDRMLYIDSKTWLPDDLLVKADKMTMANSLELRVPLLDHKILEFAASLPDDFKVRGKETKRALKAAFSKALPQEILTRKKAGFPVPYNSWLGGDLSDRVREVLLSEKARSRGYFNPSEVSRLLDEQKANGRHAKEVFSLLALELWHRQFCDGVKAGV